MGIAKIDDMTEAEAQKLSEMLGQYSAGPSEITREKFMLNLFMSERQWREIYSEAASALQNINQLRYDIFVAESSGLVVKYYYDNGSLNFKVGVPGKIGYRRPNDD